MKAGCCGIVGPVPPPLWIRPLILRSKVAISVTVCQSADHAVSVILEELAKQVDAREFPPFAFSLAGGGARVL
jgi:hypothetical protein